MTVLATAINMSEPAKVGKGLIKQEVTIADATEASLLTLWENDVVLQLRISRTSEK